MRCVCSHVTPMSDVLCAVALEASSHYQVNGTFRERVFGLGCTMMVVLGVSTMMLVLGRTMMV